jgi:hypothetical protein
LILCVSLAVGVTSGDRKLSRIQLSAVPHSR